MTVPRKRRECRSVTVGNVRIGDGSPISVQTMTKTDTRDVKATIAQIRGIEGTGCAIVRLAVPDADAARALRKIRKAVSMPLIADIHFDHRLAVGALDAGIDGLRINPGNIGGEANVREVVAAARDRKVPIRIGVNSGSVEKDIMVKYGAATPEALVESAMRHVRILEDAGYREIKISVKASDAIRTIEAYRLLARRCDYPLHVGVTEAGTFLAGTVRSSVAIGILLAEGIGDTIRVSLTDAPEREVRVGLEILRSLDLCQQGPNVISCPTCGRTQVDVASVAEEVERELERHYRNKPTAKRLLIAVMGCMVNGPGEARHADIALAGGKAKFALYVRGKPAGVVPQSAAIRAVMKEVRRFETRQSDT